MTKIAIALGLLGIVLFLVSVVLRTRSGGRYEIKSTDIVLLLLPGVVPFSSITGTGKAELWAWIEARLAL